MESSAASVRPDAVRVLGAGKMAEVLEHGAFVLKLYRPGVPKENAFREAAILSGVEGLGLPAPRVQSAGEFGERWGIVMTRAAGTTFGEAATGEPGLLPRYLEAMVALHRRVHEAVVPGFGSLKVRVGARIAAAGQLGQGVRERLLERLAELPDGDRLCHGDFHPYNILGEPANGVIVDWLDATRGAPAADVCRSFLLIRHHSLELARAYVDAYLASGGVTEQEVYAWLPVTAAARLVENVPEETEQLLALAEAV